jgi:hypothetical protein
MSELRAIGGISPCSGVKRNSTPSYVNTEPGMPGAAVRGKVEEAGLLATADSAKKLGLNTTGNDALGSTVAVTLTIVGAGPEFCPTLTFENR